MRRTLTLAICCAAFAGFIGGCVSSSKRDPGFPAGVWLDPSEHGIGRMPPLHEFPGSVSAGFFPHGWIVEPEAFGYWGAPSLGSCGPRIGPRTLASAYLATGRAELAAPHPRAFAHPP